MKDRYQCIIVGSGPAGLAAASTLGKMGIKDVLVLERNEVPGGILNQCVHTGFGLSYFGDDMTGPEFARAMERKFALSGVELALGAMVLEIARGPVVKVASRSSGYREIGAAAVIVATGCRERTRDNLEIAGTRPAGVFTAGQAQNLVNRKSYAIGKRVVVQGSGDIGLIMARRLTIEGCKVAGVFERLPYLSGLVRNKVQCLDHFGIPLAFRTQVCEIVGARRVEGVYVESLNENLEPLPQTRRFVECDTVLFSVGLIPEVDILKGAGIMPLKGGSVAVNSHFEADDSGIFVCGNALHIHDLADNASREGEIVAAHVVSYLEKRDAYSATATGACPYRPLTVDTSRDGDYFERVLREGAEVCIVCPKGCIVSERGATCPRGARYFEQSRTKRSQILTTTIGIVTLEGRHSRLPVKSLEPVDVESIPRIKAALEDLGEMWMTAGRTAADGGRISVCVDGAVIEFDTCDRA